VPRPGAHGLSLQVSLATTSLDSPVLGYNLSAGYVRVAGRTFPVCALHHQQINQEVLNFQRGYQ
jgi:hypothetical protein